MSDRLRGRADHGRTEFVLHAEGELHDLWLPMAAPRPEEVRLTKGDDGYRGDRHGPAVYVLGLAGDDLISGTSGDDLVSGGGGHDSLNGRPGDDRLFGGGGADSLLGGAGRDTLFGAAGGDSLQGGRGADVLIGGAAADFINVGESFQLMSDRSRDRVIYTDVSDSRPGARDEISFFDPDRDVIDLRRVDADTTSAGNQPFHFVGDAAFSGTPGELAYHPGSEQGSTGVLAADVDGDGQADMMVNIIIFDGSMFDLTEANFKL